MYISNDIFTIILYLFLKLTWSTATLMFPWASVKSPEFQGPPINLKHSMFEPVSHVLVYMVQKQTKLGKFWKYGDKTEQN